MHIQAPTTASHHRATIGGENIETATGKAIVRRDTVVQVDHIAEARIGEIALVHPGLAARKVEMLLWREFQWI